MARKGKANGKPEINLDSELIETIYQTALEPQRYDDLMDKWRLQIETAVSKVENPELESSHGEDLIQISEGAAHFQTAFGILEAMGRDKGAKELAPDGTRGAARFIMSTSGQIVWHNGLAAREFGINSGTGLQDLGLSQQSVQIVEYCLGTLGGDGKSTEEQRPFAIAIDSRRSGRPVHMIVSHVQNAGDDGALLFHQAGALWRDEVGHMMATGFALSPAEIDIVASLVDGNDINEISEIRQRTVATVRTQLKSILKKTATRSQSELLRLCLSLSMHQPQHNARRRYLQSGSVHRFKMQNGAKLIFHFYGPAGGRPVLFIHGMLDGIQCTEGIEDLLYRHNIRLIGIERPNFAGSDPYNGRIQDLPEYVASGAFELIDHLELTQRLVVVGHMAGSLYAFAIAARRPDQIKAIVSISGGVPIVSSAQIKSMSLRQRLIAYTARYTPSALPFMLRAGIKQLDTGGDRNFMKALYRDSAEDQAACADPEIFDVVSNGYHFSVMRGHEAFEGDSYHVVRDWSWLVKRSNCPVHLIHGHHDPVVKWQSVQKFAERLGDRALLHGAENCGQLIYYFRPEKVFEVLEQSLADNKNHLQSGTTEFRAYIGPNAN